jgi:hypothetical protein
VATSFLRSPASFSFTSPGSLPGTASPVHMTLYFLSAMFPTNLRGLSRHGGPRYRNEKPCAYYNSYGTCPGRCRYPYIALTSRVYVFPSSS